MLQLLAQTIEPLRILRGDEVATADHTVWVVAGSFAGAAFIMLFAFFVFRRAKSVQADPQRAAWKAMTAKLGIGRRERRTLEQLAAASEIKPCALVLSRGALERAVLLCAPQFSRAELQRACSVLWADVEVPGAAGHLPTVSMPEVRPPRPFKRAGVKRTEPPRLRASA